MTPCPSVTLIVCSYNQERYIEEAVRGALSQTYSPIEIILSDDCSSDQTFQKMEALANQYSGPNKILLNRNIENLGLIDHVNKVLAMASGELVIGSAGDDISLPERVETLVQLYRERERKPTLFHGDVIQIGPDSENLGLWKTSWGKETPDLTETALRSSLHIGASSTFTRELLELFPPIYYKETYEDLIWGFRAALTDSLVYIDKPLVQYRTGVGISWTRFATQNPSLDELKNTEYRRLVMFRDVLKQRLLDIDHLNAGDRFEEPRRSIVKKLGTIDLDIEILRDPEIPFRDLLRKSIHYLRRRRTINRRLKRRLSRSRHVKH